MRLATNLTAALRSVRESPRRSVLSAMGVAVATFAIVTLTAISLGVRDDFAGQIDELGVGVLVVIPGRLENGMNFNLGGASYLEPKDADALGKLPGVLRTARFSFVGGAATYKGKQAPSFLVASSPEWFEMHKTEIAEGRTLKASDTRPVALIGAVAKEAMFGAEPALGKSIDVNGVKYEIVGISRDKKSENSILSVGGFQNVIYIPYDVLRAKEPQSQTDRIMVQMKSGADPKALIASMENTLAKRLDRSQFSVLTQEDLLKLVYRFMGILTWLVSGLTGIALFIGGMGIMTVMLLSVGERVGEIGIRKAVGARRGDVFLQFLFESVLLSGLGAAAGLAVGALFCAVLDRLTPIHPLVTGDLTAGTLAVGLVIGALFGLLPARRAARLTPVEAMRSI